MHASYSDKITILCRYKLTFCFLGSDFPYRRRAPNLEVANDDDYKRHNKEQDESRNLPGAKTFRISTSCIRVIGAAPGNLHWQHCEEVFILYYWPIILPLPVTWNMTTAEMHGKVYWSIGEKHPSCHLMWNKSKAISQRTRTMAEQKTIYISEA